MLFFPGRQFPQSIAESAGPNIVLIVAKDDFHVAVEGVVPAIL